MRRIAIISKPQKNELQTLLPELVAWLKAKGFTPVLDPVSGSYIGTGDVVPRPDMAALTPELVIVLGGDGTLLSAARAFAKTEVPILSVNLGSLGFLTEVRLSDLFIALDGWQKGTCRYDVRAMLHVELWREGKLYSEYEALNDVVVSKGAIARMGEFTIQLDGQKVASIRADGMIVATPTGSTGYALAANGPIVLANVNAMVVTPICPHLLTIRPLVVHGDAAIHMKIEGVPDQMYITVDGQEALLIAVGDEVHCKRSQFNVRLIRVHEGGFFDVLRSKLKWGER
jgi:NAD+ kinase